MKNKLLIIAIIAILLFVNTLIYRSVGIGSENGDEFLYKILVFWLGGVAFLYSCYFLFSEIRKLNSKILKPLVLIMLVSGVALQLKYGGAFASADNWLNLFREPIVWMLNATLISHLVLFIYKRNNQQLN